MTKEEIKLEFDMMFIWGYNVPPNKKESYIIFKDGIKEDDCFIWLNKMLDEYAENKCKEQREICAKEYFEKANWKHKFSEECDIIKDTPLATNKKE